MLDRFWRWLRAGGNRRAMVRLGSLFEPGKEQLIVVEERYQDAREDDDRGGGRGRTRPLYDSVRDDAGTG